MGTPLKWTPPANQDRSSYVAIVAVIRRYRDKYDAYCKDPTPELLTFFTHEYMNELVNGLGLNPTTVRISKSLVRRLLMSVAS